MLLCALWLPGQISQVLTAKGPLKIQARRGGLVSVPVSVGLQPGYHVNSHTPSEDYLIPLRLTWDESLLKAQQTTYPKPEFRKYSFSEKPLAVYTGAFEIQTRFEVPSTAPLGMAVISGKLRYQACNDSMCLPPRTVEIKIPVEVRAK